VGTSDLALRRPDFHGVVVRAFGGVFSWSMYGVQNAADAPGSGAGGGGGGGGGLTGGGSDSFTEYVMRYQGGPDLQRMTPWIVARRYREFDALDKVGGGVRCLRGRASRCRARVVCGALWLGLRGETDGVVNTSAGCGRCAMVCVVVARWLGGAVSALHFIQVPHSSSGLVVHGLVSIPVITVVLAFAGPA
jgi:hypothetical protein